MRIVLLFVLSALSGCGPKSSPYLLLESESPVDHAKLRISCCAIGDVAIVDSRTPVRLKRSRHFELSGMIGSGEWQAGRLVTYWKPRDSESSTVVSRAMGDGSTSVMLLLHIYGSEVSKNFGIISTQLVECRLPSLSADDMEFRVKVLAPSSQGNYVCDIQAFDQSAPILRREVPTKTAAGIPIWRLQLAVE